MQIAAPLKPEEESIGSSDVATTECLPDNSTPWTEADIAAAPAQPAPIEKKTRFGPSASGGLEDNFDDFDEEDFDDDFDDDFEEEVEGEYELQDDEYGEEFREMTGDLNVDLDEDGDESASSNEDEAEAS